MVTTSNDSWDADKKVRKCCFKLVHDFSSPFASSTSFLKHDTVITFNTTLLQKFTLSKNRVDPYIH